MAFGCRATANAVMAPPAGPPPHPTSFILVVPLFHVTGCVAVMLNAVAAGTKLVLMYKWDPERALELIEREHITQFVGVPTMSWDLLESPDFAAARHLQPRRASAVAAHRRHPSWSAGSSRGSSGAARRSVTA